MNNSTLCTTRTGKPRACYSTQEQAQSAADYAESAYGNAMVPYFCNRCSYWHLCPKDRHTPSTICNHCTDGNGRPKQLYLTYESAKKRAQLRYEEDGVLLNVYECCHNRGWHLTKNDLW
ncbi:hypothetical protein [Oceanobacter mangrovi]|uniref:hypothetical protein n=1 Tax=Oceanobacter mangrovi TaxID=2862510 RepID=UPI001C8EF913|nr:hypothetical protein [Oceanobacter mangrovi]